MSKRRYCSDSYPAHDPGGCPDCAPKAPRIVAECWTCEDGLLMEEPDRIQQCYDAGHDVREVKP